MFAHMRPGSPQVTGAFANMALEARYCTHEFLKYQFTYFVIFLVLFFPQPVGSYSLSLKSFTISFFVQENLLRRVTTLSLTRANKTPKKGWFIPKTATASLATSPNRPGHNSPADCGGNDFPCRKSSHYQFNAVKEHRQKTFLRGLLKCMNVMVAIVLTRTKSRVSDKDMQTIWKVMRRV